MPAAPEPSRTVTRRVQTRPDRETHISTITWPDRPDLGEYVEIADYIPSRKLYGRGYMFPAEFGAKVATGVRLAGNSKTQVNP